MKSYPLFKFLAFRCDPEWMHHLTLSFMQHYPLAGSLFAAETENWQERYGLSLGEMHWRFPIGLAAGLDKNAVALDFFSHMPFGALEVGTVTPQSQPGNPRPRLFRLPQQQSLRNQMGFNNDGAQAVLVNLQKTHAYKNPHLHIPIGVNLGKNKTTPNHLAYQDYQKLYALFAPHAQYLVINVSSPNTPDLRKLQSQKELRTILESLLELRKRCPCPLWLKISPDLQSAELEDVVALALEFGLAGLIATNTTILPEYGSGGISGQLLTAKARQVQLNLLQILKGEKKLQIIGVGGVSSFSDLWTFWQHGGRAMQIYTAFIYHGPSILIQFMQNIEQILLKHSLKNVQELLLNIHHIKERY